MEYIQRVLGLDVARADWKGREKLSYFMLEAYHFEEVSIAGYSCLFIKPQDKLAPMSALKKHIDILRKQIDWPVVFELEEISSYRKTAFIEGRIPFVVPGRQLYLPFIGVVQRERGDAEPSDASVEKLIPSAQMLLFYLILENCRDIFVSEAARRFDMTPMSISRAAIQLERAGLVRRESRGVRKYMISDDEPGALFKKALPFLINPVRKVVFIKRDDMREGLFDAGLSALSKRGMLNPPAAAVYGTVQSDTAFKTRMNELIDDSGYAVLEIWKYDPTLITRENEADPLSLYMSLAHIKDERVEQALEDMLKELF